MHYEIVLGIMLEQMKIQGISPDKVQLIYESTVTEICERLDHEDQVRLHNRQEARRQRLKTKTDQELEQVVESARYSFKPPQSGFMSAYTKHFSQNPDKTTIRNGNVEVIRGRPYDPTDVTMTPNPDPFPADDFDI